MRYSDEVPAIMKETCRKCAYCYKLFEREENKNHYICHESLKDDGRGGCDHFKQREPYVLREDIEHYVRTSHVSFHR